MKTKRILAIVGCALGAAVIGGCLYLNSLMPIITGVGGGVIRDVLSLEMPMIFVKHVYACASILGAIVMFVICSASGSVTAGIMAGFFVTLVIRYLAAHFGWNLPKIKN